MTTTTTTEPIPSGTWTAQLSTGRTARLRLDVEARTWRLDVWQDDDPDMVLTSVGALDEPGWYGVALAFGAIGFPGE